MAAATIGFFYRSVLSPGRFLGIQDLVFFHLPLRAEFARLAKMGLPLWNPTLHGGQPILSNPNYGAFYPPSWIVLLLEPVSALKILILLHAIWGFGGAWRLASRLGCGRLAAALAAIGFAGGGWMVSSVGTLSPFFSLAWFPWVVSWALGALEMGAKGRSRSVVLAPVGIAMQLVAGEPTVAFLTAITLVVLASLDPTDRLRKVVAILAILAAGAGLAAVQLVPTMQRVSAASEGVDSEGRGTLVWSTAPERLAEAVFPRFHGEPTLASRGLYFASGVHDKTHPYLLSIFPGQVVLALALAGLLTSGTPRRFAWALLLAAGIFLALGRHNPIYSEVLSHLPPFRWIRYPEKFLLLTTAVLPFLAAVATERLVSSAVEHEVAHRRAWVTACFFALANLILAAWLGLAPAVGAEFIQARTPEVRSAGELAAGVAFIGRGALLQLALALLMVLVIVGGRKRKWTMVILPLLVAADLALANRWVNPTVAIESFLSPPASAGELVRKRARIATDQGFFLDHRAVSFSAVEGEEAPWIRRSVDLLDPFVGTLWGLSYALNPDYDLMATWWADHALELFYTTAAQDRSLVAPLLGAWAVEAFVVRRPPEAIQDSEPPIETLGIRGSLEPVRFVPEARYFRSVEEARADVVERAFDVDRLESLIAPRDGGRLETFDPAGVVDGVRPRSDGVEIQYRTAKPGLLVLATTYDEGWRASVGKTIVPVLPTALGQTAIRVPEGQGSVILRFRQPWLGIGALVSLATVLILFAVPRISGRRDR